MVAVTGAIAGLTAEPTSGSQLILLALSGALSSLASDGLVVAPNDQARSRSPSDEHRQQDRNRINRNRNRTLGVNLRRRSLSSREPSPEEALRLRRRRASSSPRRRRRVSSSPPPLASPERDPLMGIVRLLQGSNASPRLFQGPR